MRCEVPARVSSPVGAHLPGLNSFSSLDHFYPPVILVPGPPGPAWWMEPLKNEKHPPPFLQSAHPTGAPKVPGNTVGVITSPSTYSRVLIILPPTDSVLLSSESGPELSQNLELLWV